jgi:hypothetical protein
VRGVIAREIVVVVVVCFTIVGMAVVLPILMVLHRMDVGLGGVL